MDRIDSGSRRFEKIVHYLDKIQIIQGVFLIGNWLIFTSFGKDYSNPYSSFLALYAISDFIVRGVDEKRNTGGFYRSLLHSIGFFPVIFGSIGIYIYHYWER